MAANYPESEVVFLGENPRKRGERDPDYTGTWKVPGQADRWASAWWSQRQDGSFYLRIIPGRTKEQRDQQHPAQAHPAGNTPPMSRAHRHPTSSGPPPGPPGPPRYPDDWPPNE